MQHQPHPSQPRRARRRALAGLAAMLALAGCAVFEQPRDPRGNRVDPELVNELVPGVQTRTDVLALLGSPTVTPAFDDVTWYYVGGMTRQRVGRQQALQEQEVIAVHFRVDGTIDRVERLGIDDAVAVSPVARVTPTPGTEQSIMQQLFGNIGRFSPGPEARRSGQ